MLLMNESIDACLYLSSLGTTLLNSSFLECNYKFFFFSLHKSFFENKMLSLENLLILSLAKTRMTLGDLQMESVAKARIISDDVIVGFFFLIILG